MANRVVVILSDDELEYVRGKAGLVPLSAWFRAMALIGRGAGDENGGGGPLRELTVVNDDEDVKSFDPDGEGG